MGPRGRPTRSDRLSGGGTLTLTRRTLALATAALIVAAPVRAQGLRSQISQLFIFSAGDEPLFLGGTADPNNPDAVRIHGSHFVPAAVSGNATIISFLTNSIGNNVANVPVAATSGGSTFRFEGGTPIRTSTSAGPIFGERAQTLGRGRMLAGLTRTGLNFKTLRGVDLSAIPLTFTHANSNFPGCDSIAHGDCSLLGVPTLENETIDLRLALDVRLAVTSFLLTYGVSDRIDVGFVLPIVSVSLDGASTAQIVPFGPPPAVHFFGGTPTNPVLTASRAVRASASGLGDVAARVKVNLRRSEPLAVAILGDVRFPTGSEEDLLGAGSVAARGLAIFSARFGDFSPHANVGYAFRGGRFDNDFVLATVGFDQLLAPWATLAADVISELQVGTSRLLVPPPVVIQAPYRRTVSPTSIPDRRDDLVNASVGVKLRAARGLTAIVNGGWPLNRGGLRPSVFWTAGVEYNF